MKYTLHLISVLMILASCMEATTPSKKDKQVVFTVLDTTGQAVEGAYIEASRFGPENAEGYTDEYGKLTLSLTEGKSLSLYVSKDGYYRTGGRLWNGGIYKGPDGHLTARIVPDSFTIEMKKVLDPVHMRRKRFRGRAPLINEPVGYDLKVGSWLTPYGTGVTTDILFHFHDIHVDGESFSGSMTISFPNESDGIQPFKAARPYSMQFGSDLAPPHRAPVDGYQSEITYSKSHTEGQPYQSYKEKQRNYLIRSRTVLDADGRIIQACYGYILGEIEFDPRDPAGPQLEFNYFFNPDPDPESRSMEFNLLVPQERRP